MKPFPLIAALVLLGVVPVHGQVAEKGQDVERAILGLEREWSDAIVKRDTARMDRILAGDYVLTTPEGQVVTKSQVLESMRAARNTGFAIKGIDLEDLEARVYGNVAVVSYRFTLKGRAGGRDVATPFRHTDVFVKQGAQWRCVSRQATRIVEGYAPARHDDPRRGPDDPKSRAGRRFGLSVA